MITKQEALQKIALLVERFEEQKAFYKQSGYNETLTRIDFIDPFFKALGWDMDNEQGYAEAYREVIHEDKLKIGRVTKAPDYAFRLGGGKRLFYVEAKKPSVAIKDETAPAYQLRRYGWNAKLPINIITDFEEFAIYDCTKNPSPTDKASVARIKYITYDKYLAEFDFLWDTFSKEKVLKGGFDKFVLNDKNRKGTTTVDHEFLLSLDNWRTYLANNIALRNKVDEEELNFIVQHIIDRIIFIRIAEDRFIEPYGSIKDCIAPALSKTESECYQSLLRLFHLADQKYNSGLFDFTKDKISSHIVIDNKVLKTIINDLYPPNSPYEFSVLSVEILGSAYEQFLGKQITLSKTGKAVIEQKPEVRKAGGVYYTPQYIVEYIVEHTIGKHIGSPLGDGGSTPAEVSTLTIVDPACGSGSFLIGAYQYLLDWHKKYYKEHGKPSKGNKDNPLRPDGHLTTAEKKRILLNNIYGVDLDANAVEVTKLSLLLKCMEGETEASIATQTALFHDRILPTLDGNIKSGNSLIGTDFYEMQFDFGEEKKIKPFDWEKAFPQVFYRKNEKPANDLKLLAQKAKEHAKKVWDYAADLEEQLNVAKDNGANYLVRGGFDCVIGNPPYRTLQLGKKQESQETTLLQYYQNHYAASFEYKINLYALFIEKSLDLLKKEGRLSFIVPNSLYNTISFKPLRKLLLDTGRFELLMDLRYKVFDEAEIGGNAVFVYSKGSTLEEAKALTVKSIDEFNNPESSKICATDILYDVDFNLTTSKGASKIIGTINNQKGVVELGSVIKIYQGIITGDNKKFLSDTPKTKQWKPILKGRDINRYSKSFNNVYVYYSPEDLWSNTDEKMFKVAEKIISRQTSDKIVGTLDTEGYFSLDSTHVLHLLGDNFSIKYFLGVYNSMLLNFLYQNRVQEGGRVFAQEKTINKKPLPIKTIDKTDKLEIEYHNEIVKLVDKLLQLNEELKVVTLPGRIEQMQGHIDYCENKINEIVYQLYGLSDEEIKIIEAK